MTLLRAKLYQLFLHQCNQNLEVAQAKLVDVQAGHSQQRAELDEHIATEKAKVCAVAPRQRQQLWQPTAPRWAQAKLLKKEQTEVDRLQEACDLAKADFTAYERKDIKFKEVRVGKTIPGHHCRPNRPGLVDPFPFLRWQEKKFLKTKIKKLEAALAKHAKTRSEVEGKDAALQQDRERWDAETQSLQAQLEEAQVRLEATLASLQVRRCASCEPLPATHARHLIRFGCETGRHGREAGGALGPPTGAGTV